MDGKIVGINRLVNRLVSQAPMSDNSDMSMSLKSLVSNRLEQLGRSPAEATERGGLSRTFIYDILKGPDDRNIRGQHLSKLARGLDMEAHELIRALNTGEMPPVGNGSASAQEISVAPGLTAPHPLDMRRDVPIMGTAMGSVFENVEGFVFEGGPIDYARRPSALAHIKDLYAIYVANDSMYPMHQAGDLRFVNPRKPPVIGGSVIVQTRKHDDDPGQAYIKVLRKRTPVKIVLEQFNPPATIEIPVQYVVSVHHVYTMNELFGV